ncbi:hypothetical protein C1H46_034698 [Malus baccata]|uniref:Uncharacterized protein n=1 Tax=Malus baccata TaxID=106549 RepID=A0A540KZS9_MALBA|nr:hypothetical protein C1H46_034698 [Malus baccata]
MLFSQVLQRSFCTATQSNVTNGRSIGAISTDLYKERNLKRLVEKSKKSSELYRFRTKLPFTRTPYAVSPPQNVSSGSRRSWRTRSSMRTSPTTDSLSDWLRFTGNLACSRMPVLDEVPEKNCERTVLSFNALWVLVGDLDLAFELGDKIFKRRLLVDVELLQTLVDWIANASRINDVRKEDCEAWEHKYIPALQFAVAFR